MAFPDAVGGHPQTVCTQPLHRYLGVPATARASLYLYNTPGEVDALVESLTDTISFFREINGM